jgi:L-threonylcarbamoyladenylate synthase
MVDKSLPHHLKTEDTERLDEVVHCLQGGGIIIYPTETLYGLGAVADRSAAIERLALIKGSAEAASYLLLIRSGNDLERFASVVPPAAQALSAAFWPGPLTIVLPARIDLHSRLIGPSGGVGLRVSPHPWCRALLERLGDALISTSANFSRNRAPAKPSQIDDKLARMVDLVVDGGTLKGIASTVVDLCGEKPVVRREGAVKVADIRMVIPDIDFIQD